MRSLVAALSLCALVGSVAMAAFPYGSVKPHSPIVACDSVPVVKLFQDRIEPTVEVAVEAKADRVEIQVASLAPVDAQLPFRDEAASPVDVSQSLPKPRDLSDVKPVKDTWLLDEMRKHIGENPTGWARNWCAKLIAMLAPPLASKVDNPNWARDWAALPKTKPKPGAIAVLKRGKGGHLGVVARIDKHGNPVLVSGNACGRPGHRVVCERTFPKSTVLAYVSAAE